MKNLKLIGKVMAVLVIAALLASFLLPADYSNTNFTFSNQKQA